MSAVEKIIASIRRKADIIRMDSKRDPRDPSLQQRAEEIMSLCDLLERAFPDET